MINRILIVYSNGFNNYELIKQEMENVIADVGVYLFDVVAGNNDKSLGVRWAIENGAPIYWVRPQPNEDSSRYMMRVAASAEYLVAFYDGKDPLIRRIIGMFKTANKHGRIINV